LIRLDDKHKLRKVQSNVTELKFGSKDTQMIVVVPHKVNLFPRMREAKGRRSEGGKKFTIQFDRHIKMSFRNSSKQDGKTARRTAEEILFICSFGKDRTTSTTTSTT